VQIKTVFENAVQRLKQAGIPEPEFEVSLLLSHVLKMERTAVLLAGEKFLDEAKLAAFEKNVSRRVAREPLAYIIAEKEFWSRSFRVSEDVLIPRPETEILLEKTLAVLKSKEGSSEQTLKILDLGTGSGVIAIIMALELTAAKVTAIDYSYKALKVARHNAKKHAVADRIDFINCDWFAGIAARAEFDAVISNPPYIAREVLAKPFGKSRGSLQPEVGDFEPGLALDGGERGIRAISRIAAELGKVLKPGGWFFMEIGADQKKEVLAIIKRTAAYDSIEIFNDYAGLPRVLQARKRRDKPEMK
jgi:release factor glutamine methyltransferase